MILDRRDLLLSGVGAAATLGMGDPVMAQDNAIPPHVAPVGAPLPGTGSSDIAAYAALTNEKKINVISLRELEGEAQKVLPPYSFAFIAGASGDEWTMRQNETAFNDWVVEPRFLSGLKVPDLTAGILGSKLSLPVITPPMGVQGFAHALKELPCIRGTSAAGTLFVNSSVSHLSMEEIAAAGSGPKWFQIYFPEDRGYARELLQRAKASGHTAIVITVDNTTFSNRERPIRLRIPPPNLGFGNVPKTPGMDPKRVMILKADLNWDDVAFCQNETGLPVLVKGILTPALAIEAVNRGCAGVWVSNHGGRAIDNSAPAIAALSRIAKAVDGRAAIILDGGIRRGQDVFRALALGASVVAVGRPILYGMALGGSLGVQAVYQRLRAELQMVMQLAGTPTVASITRDCVAKLSEI